MKNADMPAMPCQPLGQDGMPSWEMTYGLTKREMFAMKAMHGLLSNPSMIDGITNLSVDFIKDSAYLLADAMLDEAEIDKELLEQNK